MALAVILFVLLLLVLYLLLVPIVLNIDTISNEYYLRVKGLTKASIEQHDTEIFRIKIRAFLTNFYVYPLKKKQRKKKKTPKVQRILKYKKKLGPIKILRLLRTFKVKRFYIDIDTGNCITNAKLYPVFAILNYNVGGTHVNFQGRNELVMRIENRMIYIIKELLT
jgi:hypothetical protein